MNNRILLLIIVLASVLLSAGRCDACCTPPYITISNSQFWLIPGYEIELTANEWNGVCLTSWQWYAAGGTTTIVAEFNGCLGGGNAYSNRKLSFSGGTGLHVPVVTANSLCSPDSVGMEATVAQMSFGIADYFIPVNDDDDDENGRMDCENVAMPLLNNKIDDDLVALTLSADSGTSLTDIARLEVGQDRGALRVWGSQTRATLFINDDLDNSQNWPANPTGSNDEPSPVYVEGTRASSGLSDLDPILVWDLRGNGSAPLYGWTGSSASKKWLTVVHVDMDLAGVNDGGPSEPYGETQEITPGGFIPRGGWPELTVKPVDPPLVEDEDPDTWRETSLDVEYRGDGRVQIWDESLYAPPDPSPSMQSHRKYDLLCGRLPGKLRAV